MKLPILSSFSSFFHKRSQSDSALSSRLQAVLEPVPRPASLTAIDGLILPLDNNNPFAAELARAALPHALTIAGQLLSPNSSSGNSSIVSAPSRSASLVSSHISAASHTVVVEVLTRRIQELEGLSRQKGDRPAAFVTPGPPISQSRSISSDVLRMNDGLSAQVAELRSRLERTTGELQILQTKNCRLESLLDLPILISVFKRIAFGESPEDALVDAVRDAVRQPSSSWRTLLEPVVGTRSPEDYIAQVNCTLRARRETRDWRKRARFWKVCAKEDDRHVDTVTPSVSLLSDVDDDVSGLVPVASAGSAHQQPVAIGAPEVRSSADSLGVDHTMDKIAGVVYSDQQAQTVTAEAASRPTEYADSVALERTVAHRVDIASQSEGPSSSSDVSCHRTLPPLASVVFRESHSIKSLSSSRKENHFGSSSSISNLRRRSKPSVANTKLVALPDAPEPMSSNPSPPPSSESMANRPATPIPSERPSDSSTPEPPSTSTSADFNFASWEHLSSFITKSFSYSFLHGLGDLAASLPKDGVQDTSVPGDSPAQSTSRVALTGSDASRPAEGGPDWAGTPTSDTPDTTPTPSAGSTPTSSPVKKSRLPLPSKPRKVRKPSVSSIAAEATAKFIKRLSKTISRPVLVDTTNAAVAVEERLEATKAKAATMIGARGRAGSGSKGGSPTKRAANEMGQTGSWANSTVAKKTLDASAGSPAKRRVPQEKLKTGSSPTRVAKVSK